MTLFPLRLGALLLLLLPFACSFAQAQNFVSNNSEATARNIRFTQPGTSARFEKFTALYAAPQKLLAGEFPVTVARRVSTNWMVEAGAGPTFRDRVVQACASRNIGGLEFAGVRSSHCMGYGLYAGCRYLNDGAVLNGFYLNPEFAYTHRTSTYTDDYHGNEDNWNVRLLMGYERLLSLSSNRFTYGGFIGFGLRHYHGQLMNSVEDGVQRYIGTVPTVHFGYRIGFAL